MDGSRTGQRKELAYTIVSVNTSILNLGCPFRFEASGLSLYIPVTVIRCELTRKTSITPG